MNTGKAIGIFRNINDGKYSASEKIEAIKTVINMETHNSISKDDLIRALDWLWDYVSFLYSNLIGR